MTVPTDADRALDLYRETYRRSVEEPEEFWLEQAGLVDWIRPPDRALDASNPPFYRWYADGSLNTCYNTLDRHVEAGHGRRSRSSMTAQSPGRRRPTPMRSCCTRWPTSPAFS